MLFATIVEASDAVKATRSRKEKVRLLADLLSATSQAQRSIVLAYLVGELPQGRIGLGPAVLKALDDVEVADVLSLADVDAMFGRIAQIAGAGSKARRVAELQEVWSAASTSERQFLAGLVSGEIRQGAQEGVLLEAIAVAAGVPAPAVRRAAMLGGSLREVGAAALHEGEAGLERFRLEPLRAVQPMLAGVAGSVEVAIEKLGRCAFEWKLDGARIQVHRAGDQVRVYSRQLREVTGSVPEVVEAALAMDAEAFVLDGEVLALDQDGRPHPFQVTMSRFGRKGDVAKARASTPLTAAFFDVLHLDGEDLIDRRGDERRAVLEQLVGVGRCVERIVTDDPELAGAFYAATLERGHEGLLAKAEDATYEAGRRGARWLKLKPAHTLDLVVLAAEWGSGRRQGFLSNLHLGARGDDGFVMLGKTFKGMTDDTLTTQTKALLALEVGRDGHVVHVRPELVVEIAFDSVMVSPQYPGGVALRFARLRRYRDDKPAAKADTIETVRGLLSP